MREWPEPWLSRRIVLRDFVIVSELELDLESGFTVLTGETGAGKSILIDALQLVTGRTGRHRRDPRRRQPHGSQRRV
jgi:DNA repair ATPase RecN